MQVGNHYICKLRDREMVGAKRWTEQFSGMCDQPAAGSAAVVRLEPPEYYSLHLLNLKPHESLLGFDASAMMRQMVANNTVVTHVHALLIGDTAG